MGDIKSPNPVQPFCGIIFSDNRLMDPIREKLHRVLGPIDFESAVIDFSYTNYYQQEMGTGLKRWFVAFEQLIPPDELIRIKVDTNSIEKEFAAESVSGATRPVNLDPGYVAPSRMILASTKDFNHRIYLGRGIYAEITLNFTNKSYSPYPWTYPDYQTLEYISFFNEIRRRLMEKTKNRT
jgi:hypothetical protein